MCNILATVRFTCLFTLAFLVSSLSWTAGAAMYKVNCDKGESVQSTIDKVKAGDVIEVSGTCTENLLIREELHDITLDGHDKATINGAGPTENTISIRGNKITIRGLAITGGHNGISVSDNATTVINGNRIYKAGWWGVSVTHGSSARLLNNKIHNNPRGGILVHNNSRAQIGVSGPPGQRAFFPNTITQNGGAAAIQVLRSSKAFIAGNVITNNQKAIDIGMNSQAEIGYRAGNLKLGGNNIQDNNSGIDIRRSSSAEIVGNIISNAPNSAGVLVRDYSHAVFRSNNISNNAGHGINVRGRSGVTLGSESETTNSSDLNESSAKNGGFGIRCVDGSYVKGALGTLNGQKGVRHFADGCVNNLLHEQKVEIKELQVSSFMRRKQLKSQGRQSNSGGKRAVQKVNCQKGESIQAKINGAIAGDVIKVSGTCIEHLFIRKELNDITLDGQGLAIIKGPDPSEATIHSSGKGITIRGFHITGGGNGIDIDQGGRVLIESNIIEKTGGTGIDIWQNSSASILGNKIQNNPSHGIRISDSSAARIGVSSSGNEKSFRPNTIVHNGKRGIQVEHTSEALIAGNTISYNRFRGIFLIHNSLAHIGLPAGKANPGANSIEGNGGGGIGIARSSTATIVGNTIRNNRGLDGIWVSGASTAEIANNTIDNNARDAIYVLRNSSVTLGNDKVTDFSHEANTTTVENGRFGIYCINRGNVKGRIGTLSGKLGKISIREGCVNDAR